jgi:hypothetical protein
MNELLTTRSSPPRLTNAPAAACRLFSVDMEGSGCLPVACASTPMEHEGEGQGCRSNEPLVPPLIVCSSPIVSLCRDPHAS